MCTRALFTRFLSTGLQPQEALCGHCAQDTVDQLQSATLYAACSWASWNFTFPAEAATLNLVVDLEAVAELSRDAENPRMRRASGVQSTRQFPDSS
jgi:hypothetical protein